MEFTHEGRRYLVSWQHTDGSGDWTKDTEREQIADTMTRLATLLSVEEAHRLGVPMKRDRKKYDGMTLCRIRTLRPEAASLPPEHRWETVAEAYSFKRADERFFDKKAARRHSLARAIKGKFDHLTRTKIWNEFNRIWPPVSPEATMWEKRYVKLRQELRTMEQQNLDLLTQLRELKQAQETT